MSLLWIDFEVRETVTLRVASAKVEELEVDMGWGCRFPILWHWIFFCQGIGKDVPRSQRTPMGNPYISPIYPYSTWVFMGYYPQESLYKPYKYHGYTVRGTPNCPLILGSCGFQLMANWWLGGPRV